MDKTNNTLLSHETSAESFEFIMGLAEQRSLVLHPRRAHAGFVYDPQGREQGTEECSRAEGAHSKLTQFA